MKVSFLIGTLFFLVISCNKFQNKPVEDYKVIETDYFIIKSKYNFGKAKQLMENELPKEILSKDTLNFVTLTGEATFMLFDEELANDENKFKELEYRFASTWNKNKTTIYYDTIINSNKIELSEVKMDKNSGNSKSIYLSAKILKEKSCYVITLTSEENRFNEDEKVFFEVLEGTTIKQ